MLPEGINSAEVESGPWLSKDARVILFSRRNLSVQTVGNKIWMSLRSSEDQNWEEPVMLSISTPESQDVRPCFCPADLGLYFTSIRNGGQGDSDIWKSTLTRTKKPER